MDPGAQRRLAWWWVFLLTPAWLIAPILLTLFLPHPHAADKTPDGFFYATTHGLVWGLVVPEALSLVVPVAMVTALRWWPRVHRDSVPTARWVIAVPVLLIVASLAFTNYGAYLDEGAAFFALVVLAVLLIGVSEELMFRGLVVELLRDGMRELWVAVISTLLFASIHFVKGGVSLPTVISALLGGYLYYITRRATVFLVFPILTHAAFDLFGFSHWSDKGDSAFYMVLFEAALFIVVLALTRFIPPADTRRRARRGANVAQEEGHVS